MSRRSCWEIFSTNSDAFSFTRGWPHHLKSPRPLNWPTRWSGTVVDINFAKISPELRWNQPAVHGRKFCKRAPRICEYQFYKRPSELWQNRHTSFLLILVHPLAREGGHITGLKSPWPIRWPRTVVDINFAKKKIPRTWVKSACYPWTEILQKSPGLCKYQVCKRSSKLWRNRHALYCQQFYENPLNLGKINRHSAYVSFT